MLLVLWSHAAPVPLWLPLTLHYTPACPVREYPLLEAQTPYLTAATELWGLRFTVRVLALEMALSSVAPVAVVLLLSQSDVVKVDLNLNPPQVVHRITGIGNKAHGLVEWNDKFIMLDSDSGALILLDPRTADIEDLWAAPKGGKFLKGLTVLDDIAYFGVNVWEERAVRDDPRTSEEVAAFDLVNRMLLWKRKVATAGLLNVIAAPHLGEESTYRASYSYEGLVLSGMKEGSERRVEEVVGRLTQAGYPPMVSKGRAQCGGGKEGKRGDADGLQGK